MAALESEESSPLRSIHLDKKSPLPVYLQIARAIQELLQSGRIPPGGAMPPEQVLAERFGVSRMTMRQANDVLERENLIERRRGRGTFATQNRIIKQEQETRSFSEEIRSRGGVPSSRMISYKVKKASAAVAECFNIAQGEPIYEIERVRLANDIPLAVESIQIPSRLCPNLERFNLVDHSLYQILEENYGIELAWSEDEISAIQPKALHREMLQIPRNTAVLLVKRKTFMKGDRLVELAEDAYRGDLFTASVRSMRSRKKKTSPLG